MNNNGLKWDIDKSCPIAVDIPEVLKLWGHCWSSDGGRVLFMRVIYFEQNMHAR
jgi:hypothetical protein